MTCSDALKYKTLTASFEPDIPAYSQKPEYWHSIQIIVASRITLTQNCHGLLSDLHGVFLTKLSFALMEEISEWFPSN